MNKTYLVHSGIKGQKWGVRRYQNSDGTLTPEGIARYGTYENMERTKSRNRKIAVGVGVAAATVGGALVVAKNRKLKKQVGIFEVKKAQQLDNLAKGRAKRLANIAAGIKSPPKYKIKPGSTVKITEQRATKTGSFIKEMFNVVGGTVLINQKGGK